MPTLPRTRLYFIQLQILHWKLGWLACAEGVPLKCFARSVLLQEQVHGSTKFVEKNTFLNPVPTALCRWRTVQRWMGHHET
jgi:hypothetical protein